MTLLSTSNFLSSHMTTTIFRVFSKLSLPGLRIVYGEDANDIVQVETYLLLGSAAKKELFYFQIYNEISIHT